MRGALLAGLMRLVVHLLWPKMRRRTGRLGGRGAPGSARAAILNALSALRPAELAPLLVLLLQPVGQAFVQPQGDDDGQAAADRCSLLSLLCALSLQLRSKPDTRSTDLGRARQHSLHAPRAASSVPAGTEELVNKTVARSCVCLARSCDWAARHAAQVLAVLPGCLRSRGGLPTCARRVLSSGWTQSASQR